MAKKKELSAAQRDKLLEILRVRFEKNNQRHKHISWDKVEQKLTASAAAMWTLHEMEESGGEPDLVEFDRNTKKLAWVDCSAESPKGRRSICFDQKALESRKENKPKNSALAMASAMGIELLTEDEYRKLQTFGEFDKKTSSWVQTPEKIRSLGGALFCDRRYDTVFVYHNGAESYYAARGFRGILHV